MFALFREKRIARYEQGANDYVSRTYEPVSLPHQNDPNIRYSLRKPSSEKNIATGRLSNIVFVEEMMFHSIRIAFARRLSRNCFPNFLSTITASPMSWTMR